MIWEREKGRKLQKVHRVLQKIHNGDGILVGRRNNHFFSMTPASFRIAVVERRSELTPCETPAFKNAGIGVFQFVLDEDAESGRTISSYRNDGSWLDQLTGNFVCVVKTHNPQIVNQTNIIQLLAHFATLTGLYRGDLVGIIAVLDGQNARELLVKVYVCADGPSSCPELAHREFKEGLTRFADRRIPGIIDVGPRIVDDDAFPSNANLVLVRRFSVPAIKHTPRNKTYKYSWFHGAPHFNDVPLVCDAIDEDDMGGVGNASTVNTTQTQTHAPAVSERITPGVARQLS